MLKSFKEFRNYVGGYRLSNPSDAIKPIASLGDTAPKRPGGKTSRGVGLHASYSTQAPGSMRPFVTANITASTKKKSPSKNHK